MKEMNMKELQQINGGDFFGDVFGFFEKVGVALTNPVVMGAKLLIAKISGASDEEIMEITGLNKLNN